MRAIDGDALQEKLTKKKPGPANARYTEGFNDALLRFKSMIHTAPTIEPERKKGTWLANSDIPKECSFCGEDWDKYVFGEVLYTGELPKFCPNCGADMRGEQE